MTCMWRRGLNKRCERPATRNLLGVSADGKDHNPTCDECAERLKKTYGFESDELVDTGRAARDGR